MTMGEIQHAVDLVKEVVDRDAAIIFGADIREDIDGRGAGDYYRHWLRRKAYGQALKAKRVCGKETENSALSPAKELYGSRIEDLSSNSLQVSAEQRKERRRLIPTHLPNPNMNLKEDSSIPPFLRKLRNKNN